MADENDLSPDGAGGFVGDDGEEKRRRENDLDDDEKVLQFLDSLDRYLTLVDSLSSTLRQGWLDLASARHSMGSSRVSSVLLDHKMQSAATTLQVTEPIYGSLSERQPVFTLSKWASPREGNCSPREVGAGDENKSSDSELRYRGRTGFNDLDAMDEAHSAANVSPRSNGSNPQKERSRSLLVFGGLVAPKLRSAQVSFESALDGIVEIANAQTLMLSTYSQLKQGFKDSS